jgi:hypothetical protein
MAFFGLFKTSAERENEIGVAMAESCTQAQIIIDTILELPVHLRRDAVKVALPIIMKTPATEQAVLRLAALVRPGNPADANGWGILLAAGYLRAAQLAFDFAEIGGVNGAFFGPVNGRLLALVVDEVGCPKFNYAFDRASFSLEQRAYRNKYADLMIKS